MIEEFEAVAFCPRCEYGAVHPFREAKHRPVRAEILGTDPLARHQRMLVGILETFEILGLDSPYDPPDAEIMRICTNCEHEWPQR